jgi:hypothetical protein
MFNTYCCHMSQEWSADAADSRPSPHSESYSLNGTLARHILPNLSTWLTLHHPTQWKLVKAKRSASACQGRKMRV